jgi:hypothetical protein
MRFSGQYVSSQASSAPPPLSTPPHPISSRHDSQAGEVDPVITEDGVPSAASPFWPPPNAPCFVASELCRQVTLGVRQADVQDYEVGRGYAWVLLAHACARVCVVCVCVCVCGWVGGWVGRSGGMGVCTHGCLLHMLQISVSQSCLQCAIWRSGSRRLQAC